MFQVYIFHSNNSYRQDKDRYATKVKAFVRARATNQEKGRRGGVFLGAGEEGSNGFYGPIICGPTNHVFLL